MAMSVEILNRLSDNFGQERAARAKRKIGRTPARNGFLK
jgi:hypothetical protein